YPFLLLGRRSRHPPTPHPFPTRRSSDLTTPTYLLFTSPCPQNNPEKGTKKAGWLIPADIVDHPLSNFFPQLLESFARLPLGDSRSEEHTSELQSRENLVCRLLLEKKKNH